MKLKFYFDDKVYDFIDITFVPESEDNEESIKEFSGYIRTFIAEPVVKAKMSRKPESSYEIVDIENGVKIKCPGKDGEELLKDTYRIVYTLFKFLDSGIFREGIDPGERDKEAKEIISKVSELSDEEIESSFGFEYDKEEEVVA